MEHREDLAELARRLRESTGSSAEREARLQRLAEQIRAGRYRVDANELARKLMEDAARYGRPPGDPDLEPK